MVDNRISVQVVPHRKLFRNAKAATASVGCGTDTQLKWIEP